MSVLYCGDKSDINLLGHSVLSDVVSMSPSPKAKKLEKEIIQPQATNMSKTLDPAEVRKILDQAKNQAFQTISAHNLAPAERGGQ